MAQRNTLEKQIRDKEATKKAIQRKVKAEEKINAELFAKRLPPGQKQSKKWVILDLGIRPEIDLQSPKSWTLNLVDSSTGRSASLSFSQLKELGVKTFFYDHHCYTGWSHLGRCYTGIPFKAVIDYFKPDPQWQFLIQTAEDGYSTNAPRQSVETHDTYIAFEVDGKPLTPDQGVIRMVIPNLYGSKGAKFLSGIEFSKVDKPGFWEQRGYHNRANVWAEERLDDTQRNYTPEELEKIFEQAKSSHKLDLSGLQLTSIPEKVYDLPYLRVLMLNNNLLEEIPPKLCKSLPRLEVLGMNKNKLKNLPLEIIEWKELRELWLLDNQIEALPPEIGELDDLACLGLDNNKLTSLPKKICKLQNLAAIFCDNNTLLSIPSEIGQLTSLRALMLSNNSIISIPNEIGNLRKLQWLGIVGTPDIPEDIVESGTQAILNFLSTRRETNQ